MSNPNQMVQDDSIRLTVLVDCEIHTLVWITNPVPAPRIGTEEADLYSYTGWYYDEEDIPFFCGDTAQAAAYMLRKELGRVRTRHPDEDIGDPLGDHHGKNV